MTAVVLGALLAASHDGQINGDTLEWRTTLVADGEGAEALEFAAPLPPDVELTLPAGCSAAAGAGGGVVGLRLPREAWRPGGAHDKWQAISISIRQRVTPDAELHVAPILSGSVVQRLTLSAGGEAVRFVPDAALGIEQHLSHAVSRGVTAASRARCDEFLGGTRATSPSIWTAYLVSDGELAERGLTGTIKTGRPSRRAALAVAAGFGALVAALAAIHRALGNRARDERDEALLQAEVARMREGDRRPA